MLLLIIPPQMARQQRSDYTLLIGTLTIPAGTLTGSFNVSTLVDDIDEENETFTITLSNPSEASIGAQSTTTITITDNDNPPTIFVGTLAQMG